MSVDVKRPKNFEFVKHFRCEEFSSRETSGIGRDMEKSVNRGRGRAGDRLQKRSASFSFPGLKGDGQKMQQHRKRRFMQADKQNDSSVHDSFGNFKRRRLGSMDVRGTSMRGAEKIVLPTKFLLGGNINDPLNLNSLNDAEVNRMLNEKTPQSSPLPMPAHRLNVEVKIPVNMHDPLNLNGGEESDDPIVKSLRKRKRHRPKKKDNKDASHNTTGLSDASLNTIKGAEKPSGPRGALLEALKIEIDQPAEQQIEPEQQTTPTEKTQQLALSSAKLTKIVSPVICQGSQQSRRMRRKTISECGVNTRLDTSRALFRRSSSPDATKLKHMAARKFRRQTSGSSVNKAKLGQLKKSAPPLLPKFPKNPQFVHGNYNRYYGYRNPNMEVDGRLRKFKPEWFECKDVLDIGCNVGHVTLAIARDFQPRKIVGIDIDHNLIRSARHNIRNFLSTMHGGKYPASSAISYGPIEAPPVPDSSTRFPRNVMFMQGNYVLERDEQLEMVREEYDAILALSLTKWMHLNTGDAGLKRAFHRMYRQLHPGGRLILEPQPWASYRKRKKLTETIYHNYHSIELRPEMFRQYLLTEVGFSKCEAIDVPFNKSKGFRRPLLLFTKLDTQYNSPAAAYPSTPVGTPRVGRPVAATVTSSTSREGAGSSYTPSKCSTCPSGSCSSSCSSSPCSSSCSSQQEEEERLMESGLEEVPVPSYTDSRESQTLKEGFSGDCKRFDDARDSFVSRHGDSGGNRLQMDSRVAPMDGGGDCHMPQMKETAKSVHTHLAATSHSGVQNRELGEKRGVQSAVTHSGLYLAGKQGSTVVEAESSECTDVSFLSGRADMACASQLNPPDGAHMQAHSLQESSSSSGWLTADQAGTDAEPSLSSDVCKPDLDNTKGNA